MTDAKTRIDEIVKANDVVLYMKGTKEMPQCGFSSRVAGVLNYIGCLSKTASALTRMPQTRSAKPTPDLLPTQNDKAR